MPSKKPKSKIPSLKGQTAPNLRAIAEHFLRLVGGPEGMALKLLGCFKKSPKGGMTQAKILFEVMNAFRATDEKSSKEDLQNLSDEDLQREAERLLKQANAAHQQASDGAEPEPREAKPGADAPPAS